MEEQFYYTELFKKIANDQKVLLNKGTWEQGITYVQSLVILFLLNRRRQYGAEREVSQKDVEAYLSLRGSTVTHILNRMEESGTIVRRKSARDSRFNHLVLTEKGEKFEPQFFQVLDQVEQLMTAGMSEEEKTLLKSLLQRVLSNLEEWKE